MCPLIRNWPKLKVMECTTAEGRSIGQNCQVQLTSGWQASLTAGKCDFITGFTVKT